MKKPSRFLRVFGVAGLLISLLAATVVPAVAQDSPDWLDDLIDAEIEGIFAGHNTIYYPWVANGEDFGLGAADTQISVQNLVPYDTNISIYVGNGNGGFDLATTAYLSEFASKTFTAAQLGIAAGTGAPVKVVAYNVGSFTGFPGIDVPDGAIALVETPVILSNPIAAEDEGGESTQVVVCVVNYHTAAQPGLGHPWGYVDAETGDWVTYSTQEDLQQTLNDANDPAGDHLVNPFGGLNNDGDCFDVVDAVTLTLNNSAAIAGVAKQTATAAVPGDDDDNGDDEGAELEQFVTTHTAVSGYNALNGIEVFEFDEWYLPIVQTNGGPGGKWNSIIRIANVDFTNNAVTARFFPAQDGSGSLQTGFQIQTLIDGGDVWNIDVSDYVPEDWVGSVHIYSDGAVFAMVDRYKVGTNMWLTNTGSSADWENIAQFDLTNGRYALLAPHVLKDWYGWNTGINVANLVAWDNQVSIQYFNMAGNATEVLNQRLAAHGMTYFYDPSFPAQDNNEQDVTTDPNAGTVGSAIIWSDYPVAAVVDGVKYDETDPNGGADTGQAISYSATQNVFPFQAVPYVTKGNPIDGSGATSGINILNPAPIAAVADVYWVNPSGFQASNFGVASVTIPAYANGFVYTLWQHNLPNGFQGAAQVVSNVPVAAVSANVNYDVDGDGSAIFNAFNPCGLYRVTGVCFFDFGD